MSARAYLELCEREMSEGAAAASSSPGGAHGASPFALSSEAEQLAYARGVRDGMELIRQQYFPPVSRRTAA